MDVHREIAAATRTAWDHASALLVSARLAGVRGADHDALADYADAARDRWHRADSCARREEDRRCRSTSVLAALDYGADDSFVMPDSYDREVDFATFDGPDIRT
ncbi:hypothetical protein Sa4125_00280 [Aureimonas sp. SA4125]|uniref:hypothetical protein n=1 Tax=Aureimonas sp. SA4125 TaxID=2826993 RepID=UPI001CC3B56F|nr:hypothetical protein [Aureimonas sp. SA4125]BDA82486.1 hypothetical protein Sa4125_00280 [Aureimonas sp. SA4125]